MRIKTIGFNPVYYNLAIKNKQNYANTNPIAFDYVQFSGLSPETKLSPKEKGVKIGESMIQLAKKNQLNKKNISKIMNEASTKEIDILDINKNENLPQTISKIVAYMQPYYNERFDFLSAELYLENFENIKEPEEQSDFIANSAHEFTHIIQREKNKDMNGVLKYFNDMETFQIISNIGFKILEELLHYQVTQIISNEEKNNKIKEEIKKGEFNFAEHGVDINAPMQILQIGHTIATQKNYDIEKTQKALCEWIYNTARDEEEAYDVTLTTYDKCEDANEETIIIRTLTKEAYKYIADGLEPIIKQF